MNALPQLVAAAFGLVGGSFLGLCAWRLPRGESVVHPGSRCPNCRQGLGARENLPLLSFLMQGGRCRACRAPIAWRYPLLELACAAAFYWSWTRLGPGAPFLRAAVFLSLLAALGFTDAECRQLPDEFTLGGWMLGLAFAARQAPGLGSALAASFGFAGLLALLALGYQKLRHRSGLGWGDVKMVGMMGAFLGVQATLGALLLASLAGAAVGLVQAALVLGSRRRRGQSWARARRSTALFLQIGALPLGVFLGLGAAAVFVGLPPPWHTFPAL